MYVCVSRERNIRVPDGRDQASLWTLTSSRFDRRWAWSGIIIRSLEESTLVTLDLCPLPILFHSWNFLSLSLSLYIYIAPLLFDPRSLDSKARQGKARALLRRGINLVSPDRYLPALPRGGAPFLQPFYFEKSSSWPMDVWCAFVRLQ